MNERPTFATQVMPLVAREERFSFEEFLEQGESFLRSAVSQITDADGDFPPCLITGHEGEINVIVWGYMSAEFQEHFLDRVVPATLGSHDLSMAALAAASYLTPRERKGADLGRRQEVVLLSALLVSGDESRELALAAPIDRTTDAGPELGAFGVVGEGRLTPAIAEALYGGIGSAEEGGAE